MRNHVIAAVFAAAAALAVAPASAADNLSALSDGKSSGGFEILHIYPVEEGSYLFDSRNLTAVSEDDAVKDERHNCDLYKS